MKDWFKIILLILITGFLAVYTYDVYQTHRQTRREQLIEKIDNEIFRRKTENK